MVKIRMSKIEGDLTASIPEALMLARLAQSEQMCGFVITMWLQNSELAKYAGARHAFAAFRRRTSTDFSWCVIKPVDRDSS